MWNPSDGPESEDELRVKQYYNVESIKSYKTALNALRCHLYDTLNNRLCKFHKCKNLQMWNVSDLLRIFPYQCGIFPTIP